MYIFLSTRTKNPTKRTRGINSDNNHLIMLDTAFDRVPSTIFEIKNNNIKIFDEMTLKWWQDLEIRNQVLCA